ncbi:ComF family protein [Marinoscillum furvescens]|uniref:ComF family protein n=1 Tax=Marinoscillum furvescens TaxID=1026 RepID=UPI0014729288|nr:phosphoribosyltransferase family protein [Marinoscillum furvescens]
MKYKDEPEIGTLMGKLYAPELLEANWPVELIVPVPLHRSKLKKRGFNQSEKFGEGLSEIMEVPMDAELVRRVKRTSTQTRKSKVERWQNTQDIYQVTQPQKIAGKSILVVDDVLTTGATAGQLVSELILRQAASVYIATIAAGK